MTKVSPAPTFRWRISAPRLARSARTKLRRRGTIEPMDLTYLREQSDDVWEKTIEHLTLSLEALAIALPLAIVLGVLATRVRWLTTPVVTLVSVLYTVPSLAFMAF